MESINYNTDLVLSPGTYQANKSIPVAESPYLEDPIEAIKKIKHILPGMSFDIIGNIIENFKRGYKNMDRKGNPIGKWLYSDAQRRWYQVRVKIAGKEISGYINELALLGKSIKKY